MPQHKKTVIIVSGPTASGKTALAIQLALHYNTSIISADSRQCYKELNIGVARPAEDELTVAPHFFIASHSLHDTVTAKTFEQFALQTLHELFAKKDIVIMAGGTGLYIQAFCNGLDDIPETDAIIRSEIIAEYEKHGLHWLQQSIQQEDHLYWQQGAIQNPQRMMRALEVIRGTGQSILSFQQNKSVQRPFNILHITLDVPVDMLAERIKQRTHNMIAAGLVEEVKRFTEYRNNNALQTVGYAEIFEYLDGKLTLEEATQQIIIHTRQYAKRQRTWFRRNRYNISISFGDDMLGRVIQLVRDSKF